MVGSPAYHEGNTMTHRKILALTCLLLPMMASAHQFETGQRVPPIGITDRGGWCLIKISLATKPGTAQLVGKVRVLQHIAGRTCKEKNATLIEAINQRSYRTIVTRPPPLLTPTTQFRVPACLCAAVWRVIKAIHVPVYC